MVETLALIAREESMFLSPLMEVLKAKEKRNAARFSGLDQDLLVCLGYNWRRGSSFEVESSVGCIIQQNMGLQFKVANLLMVT